MGDPYFDKRSHRGIWLRYLLPRQQQKGYDELLQRQVFRCSLHSLESVVNFRLNRASFHTTLNPVAFIDWLRFFLNL